MRLRLCIILAVLRTGLKVNVMRITLHYQTTRSTKRIPEVRTKNSMQKKKRTFQKKGQDLRNRVITMPQPPFTKIYQRKVGDPSNKIYSDEGMYGDEKDD